MEMEYTQYAALIYGTERKGSSRFGLSVILMGLLFFGLGFVEFRYSGVSYGRAPVKIMSGVQIAVAGLYVLFHLRYAALSSLMSILLFLFVLWSSALGHLMADDQSLMLQGSLRYLNWLAMYFFFYSVAREYPNRIYSFLILMVIVLPMWCLMAISESDAYSAREGAGIHRQAYGGYYALAFLPFVLMNRRKLFKGVGVAIITVATIYSLKRGAVLALVLAGIACSLASQVISKSFKEKLTRFMWLVVGWGVGVLTGVILYIYYMGSAIDRRLNLSDPVRLQLWADAWKLFTKESSFTQLVVGRGFRLATSMVPDCHNDYLGYLIQYGLIGFVLLLLVNIQMARLCWRMLKQRSEYAIPALAAFVILFCMQMYSYGWDVKTTGFVMGAFGFALGEHEGANEQWEELA